MNSAALGEENRWLVNENQNASRNGTMMKRNIKKAAGKANHHPALCEFISFEDEEDCMACHPG
jgi:hypothetical protein